MPLNDKQLRQFAIRGDGGKKIIASNYHYEKIRKVGNVKVVSFGQSNMTYDLQADSMSPVLIYQRPNLLKRFIKRIKNLLAGNGWIGYEVDVKNFDQDLLQEAHVYTDESGKFIRIPPFGFALVKAKQKFDMPDNIGGLMVNKSTYNRAGIVQGAAWADGGWSGDFTHEVANLTGFPARLYLDEGIAQMLFFEFEQPHQTYGSGKYQNQIGVTPARI